MKSWRVRLSQAAQADFSAIVAWTAAHFGDVQAQKYADILTLAIAALHEGPDVIGAKTRHEIDHGLMSLHVARMGRKGSHFVVFRVATENTIDVLRVLHESMDLMRHLQPENLQH